MSGKGQPPENTREEGAKDRTCVGALTLPSYLDRTTLLEVGFGTVSKLFLHSKHSGMISRRPVYVHTLKFCFSR